MPYRHILLVVLTLLSSMGVGCSSENRCDIEGLKSKLEKRNLNIAYISQPMSIEEIEKKQMASLIEDGKVVIKPFGRINGLWEQLKAKRAEGDCFVYFDSDGDSPYLTGGTEGYILIRGDEDIGVIVTRVE